VTVKLQISAVQKVIYAQAAVSVVIALLFYGVFGAKQASSAFVGCMVGFIPNAYFGIKILLSNGADPKKILNTFYFAELIKFVLTAVLFAVAIKIPMVEFKWLIVGYLAVISVFWFAVLIWRN
jgi:ATP synthase protein I